MLCSCISFMSLLNRWRDCLQEERDYSRLHQTINVKGRLKGEFYRIISKCLLVMLRRLGKQTVQVGHLIQPVFLLLQGLLDKPLI